MCIEFTSEKALEDYICENNALDDFLYDEFDKFNIIGIELIGRQVRIDNSHIIDLLYYCDVEAENKLIRFYIVIELKNVKAKSKDLCQLSRYTGILKDCFDKNDIFNNNSKVDYFNIRGYLVAPSFDQDLLDLSSSNHLKNEIKFVQFIPEVTFIEQSYSWKDEYIKNLQLDERIIKKPEEEEE